MIDADIISLLDKVQERCLADCLLLRKDKLKLRSILQELLTGAAGAVSSAELGLHGRCHEAGAMELSRKK